ncbi:MAG: glycoside hydrolase family 2 TIM barrel-domain containing protein [Solirubrobacteraceae bacterium]
MLDHPRRLAFVTLLAFLAMAAPASKATLGEGPPVAVALDTGWEVRFDPEDVGLDGGWESGRLEEDWQDVTVPHVFNAKPIDDQFLGTNAWYRLRLRTPVTPAGFGWALRFAGVRREATVWLNGTRLGRRDAPFAPFTLPAEGLRAAGQLNELVVRVSNLRDEELREGWWNWGGITRPVTLEPVGRVEWEDLGVLSDVDCEGTDCAAVARTDGWLVSHSDEVEDVTLTVGLTSPSGKQSAHTEIVEDLQPGERRRVGFGIDVEDPMLWSPVTPNLYAAQATASVDGEVQQMEQRRIGLRFVRVRRGRLYLNGNELQLRGASIQEDVPGRGPALRDEDIETIIDDLQRLQANVTRAQYPLDERLLSRLDEEGILVWSQAPVYHEDEDLEEEAGRVAALGKVRTTVLTGRNHPSVLTHSVANELDPYADDVPGTRDFLERAAVEARDLDDTVPVALDLLSYPNIPRQEVYDAFGLLGINSYYGWYGGKEGTPQSTEDFDDLAPFLRYMREIYPRQAQIVTEFGAESTFSGPETVKETYEFQANYVRDHLRVVDEMPWLAGAIYWTAREFYVKPDWDGGALRRNVERDALHNKGLIKYDGTAKPAFDVAREVFSNTPIYR